MSFGRSSNLGGASVLGGAGAELRPVIFQFFSLNMSDVLKYNLGLTKSDAGAGAGSWSEDAEKMHAVPPVALCVDEKIPRKVRLGVRISRVRVGMAIKVRDKPIVRRQASVVRFSVIRCKSFGCKGSTVPSDWKD
jgi:hypothetical protein